MKTLETEKLILRSFQESDLDDLYEYAKSPNVGPNAGWPPHESKEDSLQILKMFMEGNEVWAIEYKADKKVIGSVGLHGDRLRSTDDIKMLGYVLSEDYWGRGLVTEASKAVIDYAFEELGVALVSVHHYPYNNQSRRVIEKCGFLYEGTLRHATKLYDARTYDLACYSMTKEEWSNKNK
ncbi:MAG TPA: GNAT family protein [Mobilitalea sp.]|nr:GNAT family protein [Mobilitalea sp.]